MEYKEFSILLNAHKKTFTRQQYRTIRGQAKAGDIDGAVKGLNKLIERRMKWEEQQPKCSLCRQPSSYHM